MPALPVPSAFSRRHWLRQVAAGVPFAALASLVHETAPASEASSERTADPHSTADAVIHLFMNGGPSQMDLFDPKPELTKRHGQAHFEKIAGEVEFPQSAGALMRSPFRFAQHGESGAWISDIMPHFAKQVDKVAMIKSMHTSNLTHEPALYKIHSGSEFVGRPALGSWVTYGLGSENRNLPGYVVLDDPLGLPVNGINNWSAGYLSPVYQGTRFRASGDPVLNLTRQFDEPDEVTRLQRGLVHELDRIHQQTRPRQPQLAARMASYELAARMQLEASDALDIQQETAATHALYGLDDKRTESYGRRCLIARRLIERGVRFVQLFINSQIWDTHANIGTTLRDCCDRTDKPVAGLLQDLQQRGLLERTLVIWGGEMGRLPIAQLHASKDPAKSGRDHNKNAMITWLAGGGVRAGTVLGKTDELGFAAVEDRVSVADFHATMLHLLGLHHEKLFVMQNGLENKLTGTEAARVVREILA